MEEVLKFWFKELAPAQRWEKSADIDRLIERRFLDLVHQARLGELYEWRKSARGRLAEIIVLDQFPRNIFRDRPEAFSSDPLAVTLAIEAERAGAPQELNEEMAAFIYMPFMHAESVKLQQYGVEMFEKLGTANFVKYAIMHRDIVERFGRFPHRNKILGRESTHEEIEFLKGPNSSF